MKVLTFLICIILLFLSPLPLGAAETIKVAAIFAITGKIAFENEMSLNGIRFAVEEVNKQGGVLGKELELLEFDNKGTALGSKLAAQQAVDAGVVTVFGASWSSHSLAMAPVLQNAEIPMIAQFSTNPMVTLVGNYIFRICYTDLFQGKILADFAWKDLGARTAGVLINADSQYSEGLANYFMKDFSEQGGKILFVENYLEKTANFRTFLEKALTLQPDVIFHPGHTLVSAFVLKQARLSGVKTTFLGGDGWNDAMYNVVGDVIEGSYFSNHWHQDSPNAKNRLFVARYKGQSRPFDPGNALSEDCVFLFVDAVNRAQSSTPEKIRDALAATKNFHGVTGTISFDSNGDPVKSAVIMKFGKKASIYVKTIDP